LNVVIYSNTLKICKYLHLQGTETDHLDTPSLLSESNAAPHYTSAIHDYIKLNEQSKVASTLEFMWVRTIMMHFKLNEDTPLFGQLSETLSKRISMEERLLVQIQRQPTTKT